MSEGAAHVFCGKCKANFQYDAQTKETFQMTFPVNNYEFLINTRMPLFSVYIHENGGIWPSSYTQVLRVKAIPRNINPSNALEKLKLYLVFS